LPQWKYQLRNGGTSGDTDPVTDLPDDSAGGAEDETLAALCSKLQKMW
jgi:hypothetical protein